MFRPVTCAVFVGAGLLGAPAKDLAIMAAPPFRTLQFLRTTPQRRTLSPLMLSGSRSAIFLMRKVAIN
jgi:hypothetical protein